MSDETDAPKAEPAPESTGSKPTKLAKKKRGASGSEPPGAASEPPKPLPGAGTPEGDKLRDANAAFEAGNYALVRTLVTELERAADPAVVDAARELRRRTSVDPVQLAFLGACFVALLIITYVYVLR